MPEQRIHTALTTHYAICTINMDKIQNGVKIVTKGLKQPYLSFCRYPALNTRHGVHYGRLIT